MTVHQCPKCELKYALKPVLDDHIWHDHPEFRHEYPVWSSTHPTPGDHAYDHPPGDWRPDN